MKAFPSPILLLFQLVRVVMVRIFCLEDAYTPTEGKQAFFREEFLPSKFLFP